MPKQPIPTTPKRNPVGGQWVEQQPRPQPLGEPNKENKQMTIEEETAILNEAEAICFTSKWLHKENQ